MPSSVPYNPFDYANPVTDPKLFAGRTKQIEDVDYYLDQGISAPQAINLAVLGDRASGKTSLLNQIEGRATGKGYAVARIKLNETDAESALSFFYSLFDAAFHAVLDSPDPQHPERSCFGGTAGKTYDTYLSLTASYEVPEDKRFCPFSFPVLYAKAQSRGTHLLNFQRVLERDLKELSKTAGRPIVFLIDECDVLSTRGTLLEMLRNMFMNLPGFMIVLAGTRDLFSLIHKVFAPFARQFKRIELGAFDQEGQEEQGEGTADESIRSLITSALRSVNIDRSVEEMLTRETFQDLKQLSGQRPYEVQLLCHFMFRNWSRHQDGKLRLDVQVLDEVLLELGTDQDLASRPCLRVIQELPPERLKVLGVLLRTEGLALEQIVFLETLALGTQKVDEVGLLSALEAFVQAGVLASVGKDHRVEFCGDAFDRIYAKYSSRQRKVFLGFGAPDFLRRLQGDLAGRFREFQHSSRRDFRLSRAAPFSWHPQHDVRVERMQSSLRTMNAILSGSALPEVKRGELRATYELLVANAQEAKCTQWVGLVELGTKWGKASCPVITDRIEDLRAEVLATSEALLGKEGSAKLLGAEIAFSAAAEVHKLAQAEPLRVVAAEAHVSRAVTRFHRKLEGVEADVSIAAELLSLGCAPETANQTLYLLINARHLEKAEALIRRVPLHEADLDALSEEEQLQVLLFLYNVAVVRHLTGRVDSALSLLLDLVQRPDGSGLIMWILEWTGDGDPSIRCANSTTLQAAVASSLRAYQQGPWPKEEVEG
jgi:GTPase SAR1 family protein